MTLVANALILLANLGVLGMTLKLYTEYFKDRSQVGRSALREKDAK
jgi:hypothetical protein